MLEQTGFSAAIDLMLTSRSKWIKFKLIWCIYKKKTLHFYIYFWVFLPLFAGQCRQTGDKMKEEGVRLGVNRWPTFDLKVFHLSVFYSYKHFTFSSAENFAKLWKLQLEFEFVLSISNYIHIIDLFLCSGAHKPWVLTDLRDVCFLTYYLHLNLIKSWYLREARLH